MRKIVKWSKKKVLAEIRAFHKSGRPLNWTIVTTEHRYHSKLLCAAIRHFGNWRNAVEAAGFDYREVAKRIRKWSKEKIIAEINRLNEAGEWLSYTEVHRSNSALVSAAGGYFGGWGKAVKAAEFPYELIKKMRRRERSSISYRWTIKWSEEMVISQIRLFYRFKKTLQHKIIVDYDRKLMSAAYRHFGSWRNAVEAAGFDYDQFLGRQQWTKEKVISEIEAFHKTKRTLQYSKVDESNAPLVSAACYLFGSWRNAVEAAGFDYDQFLGRQHWTKERVISEIRAFYRAKGTLGYRVVMQFNSELYAAGVRYFGVWWQAVKAAGFEPDRWFILKRRKWTKGKVISRIKAYYKTKKTLRLSEIQRNDLRLCSAACKHFGSWRKAVEAGGFDYDQFLPERKWTKQKVISGIQAFYKAKGTLQYREVCRKDKKLYMAARRHFGSWRKAVEAAGFDYDQFLPERKWTKERIISDIRAFYKAKGTLQHKELFRSDWALCSIACIYFGSWRKAVEAAGFDYDQFLPERKWTKEKVISEIKAYYKAKGTLQYSEVDRDNKKLCSAAGYYFGSWRKAVEAAGFDYDQFLPERKWTKEKVISGIQAFYKAKGTLRYSEVEKSSVPFVSAACRLFCSWRKVVEAAGFDYDQFRGEKKG